MCYKVKHICENCKTGEQSYRLDPTTQVCPYMEYYYNSRCSFYEPLEVEQEGFFKKFEKFLKLFKRK